MATKYIAILISVYLFGPVYSAQFRGPPCDVASDCPSNADCIIKVCECNENYILNGDWTKCLPVLVMPYNATMKCEEDYQCTPTMSAGAICSEEQCVCKEGYHYLHGICHRSSGLDETCKTDNECYQSYSNEALKCGITNTCECADGFYKVDAYQTCRKEGKNVGDECLFDIDCTTPNLYCNTTINQCVENPDQMITAPSYTVARQVGTRIGNLCSVRIPCTPSSKMECINSECLCKSGYSEYKKYCMPDLGEQCTDGSDCVHIEHAECGSDNTCRCKLPYVKHVNNKECRMSSMDGEECEMDEQCMYMGGGAACLPDEKSRLSCLCRTGYHYEESIKLCILDTELLEACYNDYDCITANSSCQSNFCQCNPDYHESNDACIPNPRGFGDYCLTSSDCVSVPNTECVSNECLCVPGYFNSDDGVTCILGLTGKCIVDADCSVNNSICQEQECVCSNETRASSNNKCLYVRERGEECEEDVQCSDLLGEEGGACLGGKCDCKDGYQYRDNSCWDIRYLGDPCENGSQCYLNSGHLDRVNCDNGFCKCDDQFQQTPDLDCLSGLTGKCIVDADCSVNNSICQEQECVCNNVTRASANDKCLYVRERGEECEEDVQCSDLLGEKGGACLGARCDCKDGYQYRDNFCWDIRYLGDPCENDSQCYLNSGHLDRVNCDNGFCKCDDQFQQTPDLDCLSGLTGKCIVDADCSVNNSICQEQECVCNNVTRASANDKCLYVRERGEECEEDVQCSDLLGEKGGACLGARCDCKDGYQYRDNFCWDIRYLGDPCENGSQCYLNSGHLDRVNCDNGFCKCDDQFQQTPDLDCLSGLTGKCIVDADCSVNNSICQEQECVCNNVTRASSNDKCLYVRERGEECEEDVQCSDLLGEKGGACLGARCDCKDGYQYRDNFCWDIRYLGDPCENGSQCYLNSGHLDRVNCDNGFCKCDDQFQQTPDLDCLSGLTGKCIVDADCSVNNSICQEQECVCNNVTRASSNDKCLYVRERGEECEEDVQCSDLLGEKGGACLGARCDCKDGYQYRDNSCWDIRFLGDPCEMHSQCYLKSGHLDRVNCENGFCKCDYQYQQTPDLDCRSGLTGKCTVDEDCSVVNSICQEQECVCNSATKASSNNKCLYVRERGEECEEDIQCLDLLGEKGGACLGGRCDCKDGYQYRDNSCWDIRYLGDYCENDNQCYLKSGLLNRVKCENGFCKCDDRYRQTPDLDCRSVPVYPDVFRGPPCDTAADCPSTNATCYSNVCQCNENYVFSADLTTCLPVLPVPYDETEKCEEHFQCSARMNAGGICSEGQCVCKEGYHYLHGTCHRSSGLDEECKVKDDCYENHNFEAFKCGSTDTCECADGFYMVDGYQTCRKEGKNVGDECMFDIDCTTTDFYCNITIHQCVKNRDQMITVPSYTEPTPSGTLYGTPCTTSTNCTPTSSMECFRDQCLCKQGYSNNDNYCKPDLGEQCTSGSNCVHISHAECGSDNACRCKLPYVKLANNRECRIAREIAIRCQTDEQCMYMGGGAGCLLKEGNLRQCSCKSGYHYEDSIKLCIPDKEISETCSNDYDCSIANSVCQSNICQCVSDYHDNNGTCIANVRALGDYCLTSDDCISLPNTECLSDECSCASDYFKSDDGLTCVLGLTGQCTVDADCSVNNSICQEQVCVCNNGTRASSNNKCLYVRERGEECEEDVQCSNLLGEKGGACLDGRCDCKDGYQYRDSSCWDIRFLGDPCEMQSQCYLKSEHLDRVNCENGFCKCDYQYQQTPDLDCRSGVGRDSASAVVIGLFFLIAVLNMRDGWTAGRP